MSARLAALAMLAALATGGAASSAAAEDAARLARLRAQIDTLEGTVTRLEAQQAVENLQAAWGYYWDAGLWDRAAALFAEQGTFEYGQRGLYRGPARIRRAFRLFGPQGLGPGRLNNMSQLQPYVTVAPDGRSAKARWRSVQQLAAPGMPGRWGAGVQENEYVLERGKWKIARLHFYVTMTTDYDQGWQGGNTVPMDGPSAEFPPDAPPTEIYRSLPGAYLPPYHFTNPVTGRSGKWPQ